MNTLRRSAPWSRQVARLLCAASAVMAVSHSVAAPVRLDDSASPRAIVQSTQMVSEHGYPLNEYVPGAPAAQRAIVDFGRIEYRLATAPYVGKNARIFLVVPLLPAVLKSPQGLVVSWRSEGSFASGSGRPGDRVPVWSGPVRQAFMNEALALRMEFALRELLPQAQKGVAVECYFEIEVGP